MSCGDPEDHTRYVIDRLKLKCIRRVIGGQSSGETVREGQGRLTVRPARATKLHVEDG